MKQICILFFMTLIWGGVFAYTEKNQGLISILTTENGQFKTYYGAEYPGVSRDEIQQLRDLQEQTPVPLASVDVHAVLGPPFSLIPEPGRLCTLDGVSGYFHREHFIIRESVPPRHQVLIEYCDDAVTSVQIRRIP